MKIHTYNISTDVLSTICDNTSRKTCSI